MNDADRMRRFVKQGDRQALSDLFGAHAAWTYGIAFSVLAERGAAEDAVQEAFLNVLTRAASYDPARPFKPWLKGLVLHAAIDRGRSERARVRREEGSSRPELLKEDPAMRAEEKETRDRLRAEMSRLPEELMLPMVLHYHAGCSYGEVAEALGIPEGTVSTRMGTAKDRLRTALATAGVALAVGTSLEDALGAAAPAAAPVSPQLVATMQSMALKAKTSGPASGPGGRGPMLMKLTLGVGLMLAAGLAGVLATRDGGNPKQAQPVASAPAAPADTSGKDKELEALRRELKDAQDLVALLRREIADQDRRREALEATLKTQGDAAKALTEAALDKEMAENEGNAEMLMRTIVDAEATFYKTDYDMDGKDFSCDLANLRNQKDGNGNPISLIDAELAVGKKGGYRFGVCATYNANGDRDKKGFAYYAVPEIYKKTGRKTYVVSSDGVMYYKDTGSNASIGTWPNPESDPTWARVGG